MYIIDDISVLGESPIWNTYNNTFMWIDIELKEIKWYENDKVYRISYDSKPTCIKQYNSNTLIASFENEIGFIDLRTYKFSPQYTVNDLFNIHNVRFNDGYYYINTDTFYVGSMDINEEDNIGTIYSYKNGVIDEVDNNICISNGIQIYNDILLYNDSKNNVTYSKLNNKERIEFIKFNTDVYPDGSFLLNNQLFTCLWNGNMITRFDLTTHKTVEKELPMKNPTCNCIVDGNIFITSSNINCDNNDIDGKCAIIKTF